MNVLLDVFENKMLTRFWVGVLESEGIPSMVQPQMGGYGMWGHDSFIPHGLYVGRERAEEARAIVASQREAGGRLVRKKPRRWAGFFHPRWERLNRSRTLHRSTLRRSVR